MYVHRILFSSLLQLKEESWSKNVGTSFKMLRPNYLLLTDWRLAWRWIPAASSGSAVQCVWVRSAVFSIRPLVQGVKKSVGTRHKDEVEAGGQGVRVLLEEIRRKMGENCSNWPWRIRSRHWGLFPKDSNSASLNPLCDNATIITCHGHGNPGTWLGWCGAGDGTRKLLLMTPEM